MTANGARKRLMKLVDSGMLRRIGKVTYTLAPVEVKHPVNRRKQTPPEVELVGYKLPKTQAKSKRKAVRTSSPELNKVLDVLRKSGLAEITRTGGNHVKVTFANRELTYVSTTPSDSRAVENFKAIVRQALPELVW